MIMEYNRKLILEDGQEYYGYAFGDTDDSVCEIVFNTSMVGYQEILSDPSYTGQAVVMTYPLIGNYGMAKDDYESRIRELGIKLREAVEIENYEEAARLRDMIHQLKKMDNTDDSTQGGGHDA